MFRKSERSVDPAIALATQLEITRWFRTEDTVVSHGGHGDFARRTQRFRTEDTEVAHASYFLTFSLSFGRRSL